MIRAAPPAASGRSKSKISPSTATPRAAAASLAPIEAAICRPVVPAGRTSSLLSGRVKRRSVMGMLLGSRRRATRAPAARPGAWAGFARAGPENSKNIGP